MIRKLLLLSLIPLFVYSQPWDIDLRHWGESKYGKSLADDLNNLLKESKILNFKSGKYEQKYLVTLHTLYPMNPEIGILIYSWDLQFYPKDCDFEGIGLHIIANVGVCGRMSTGSAASVIYTEIENQVEKFEEENGEYEIHIKISYK